MKKYLVFSLLFAFLAVTTVQAQETWKTLSKISYKKQYDEMMGFEVDVPIFSKDIMALQGKEVVVQGYIIPVEEHDKQTSFVFSAFPYNMCFFCGNAGPETVMEVYTKNDVAIKFTSKPIKIKGVLQLNSGDINNLMYILNDAVRVKE